MKKLINETVIQLDDLSTKLTTLKRKKYRIMSTLGQIKNKKILNNQNINTNLINFFNNSVDLKKINKNSQIDEDETTDDENTEENIESVASNNVNLIDQRILTGQSVHNMQEKVPEFCRENKKGFKILLFIFYFNRFL